MTDDPVSGPHEAERGTDAGWREADLKRAIAAAQDAGLTSYRIEIATDGTITIFVGSQDQPRSG
jgi:hypothetical protein